MQTVMPLSGFPNEEDWPTCCNVNFYEKHNDAVGPRSGSEPLFATDAHPMLLTLHYGGSIFMAVTLGSIFADLDYDLNGAQDRIGVLFFMFRLSEMIARHRWQTCFLRVRQQLGFRNNFRCNND